jgi:hypothetical protein
MKIDFIIIIITIMVNITIITTTMDLDSFIHLHKAIIKN